MLQTVIKSLKGLFKKKTPEITEETRPQTVSFFSRYIEYNVALKYRLLQERFPELDIDAFFFKYIKTQNIPKLRINQALIVEEAMRLFGEKNIGLIIRIGENANDYNIYTANKKNNPDFSHEINCIMHQLSEMIEEIPVGYDIETISVIAWMYWRCSKRYTDGQLIEHSKMPDAEDIKLVNQVIFGEGMFKALVSSRCAHITGLNIIRRCIVPTGSVEASNLLVGGEENAINS